MEAEELIAAIVADPDDQTAWMVYADWLLERNHPRGELIQLGPLATAGDNEARWQIQRLEVDEDPLLSPRLAARGKQWRFTFERGFIRLAQFQAHGECAIDAESIAALCGDPHAGLMRRIVIAALEYRGPVDEITGLRQLVNVRTDVGDLDYELARLRWLQRLDVHGIACRKLSHRNLRHLGIDSITSIDTQIDLPSLEALEWQPMGEQVGFGTVLQMPMPNLHSISIQNGYSGLVAELAELRVASQLEGFSMRTEDLATLNQLVVHASSFPKLRKIHITGLYESLAKAEVDELRGALEGAYPAATIYAPWRDLVPQLPTPEEQLLETPHVDDQSRRADGTIDPIARWMRRD